MGWNFILQGDEKQGMILIQDEGMDFQPSYIWILIKFFINLWDNISCLKGVDHRVCFPVWDRMEISFIKNWIDYSFHWQVYFFSVRIRG